MGSVAWEKTVRELVPVSRIVTVIILFFFLEKSSKPGTLTQLVRSALEPVAFWLWKPHQGAWLPRPYSLIRFRDCNGTNLLLPKHNRLAPEVSMRALEMKNKRNQSLRGPVMVGVLVERNCSGLPCQPF